MSTVTVGAQHYMELLDAKKELDRLQTANGPAPAVHPDTVRLNHLIEWHHCVTGVVNGDHIQSGGTIESLHFIFENLTGESKAEQVRKAIDGDIFVTAARPLVRRA